MINGIHVFVIMMAVVLNSSVVAQPFIDILNIRYQEFPGRSYLENKVSQKRTRQYTGRFMLPFKLKKDVLLFGGSYDNLAINNLGDGSESAKLYGISIQVGFIKNWKNEKWATMAMIIPRVSSDMRMKFISGKHFQLGGVLLFTYKKKKNFKYKFGLYYNREFFGDFFIPLAGIEWNINKRLNLFGVLPGSMNLEYKFNNKIYGGIAYNSITASYRITTNLNPGRYYVRDGHPFWGHNQVKLFLNYYVAKNVVVYSEFGHTFWRRFDLYNEDNDLQSFQPVFENFEDRIFFNVGIALRVRLDN